MNTNEKPPLPVPSKQPEPQALGDSAGMRVLLPVGRSGWSIAAGYLGFLALAVIPAPLALAVSLVAIADIQKSKNTDKPKYGMARAVFGLIMGLVGTAVLAFVVILAL